MVTSHRKRRKPIILLLLWCDCPFEAIDESVEIISDVGDNGGGCDGERGERAPIFAFALTL